MKQYKYIGIFKSAEEHAYQLEVICNGYLQAFNLLTENEIKSARHYYILKTITDEKGKEKTLDDIMLYHKITNFQKIRIIENYNNLKFHIKNKELIEILSEHLKIKKSLIKYVIVTYKANDNCLILNSKLNHESRRF